MYHFTFYLIPHEKQTLGGYLLLTLWVVHGILGTVQKDYSQDSCFKKIHEELATFHKQKRQLRVTLLCFLFLVAINHQTYLLTWNFE